MHIYSNIDELNKVTITCRKCPRLTAYRQLVAQQKRRAYRDWDYWGKPVPGFGDPAAQVWAGWIILLSLSLLPRRVMNWKLKLFSVKRNSPAVKF